MIRILFFLLLFLNAKSAIVGQKPGIHNTNDNDSRIISGIGIYLLSSLPMVFIHETGLYFTAELLGAKSNQMIFIPPRHGAGSFDHPLSRNEKMILKLSGPLTTRLSSECVDGLLNHFSFGNFGNRFMGGLYLSNRFDLPFTILTSFISHGLNFAENNNDDIFSGYIEPYFKKHEFLGY